MGKTTVISIISAALIIGVCIGWVFLNIDSLVNKNPVITVIQTMEQPAPEPVQLDKEREMERELIRMDMEDAGRQIGLSTRQQEEYISYVEFASEKYQVPMILIHSIAYVESNYDPSAVHPAIYVRNRQTRALGLMGIVWEYNGEALVREKIANTRLELTEPKTNILAGACILHMDITEVLAQNSRLTEDRFFDELIKKYYGAYNDSYKLRMLGKLKDISSRQWIRRTVRNIFQSYTSSRRAPLAPIPADTTHEIRNY